MVKGIFVNHELLVLIAENCEITFPFLVKRDFGDLFFLLKRKMPNSLSVKCETANLFSMKSDQYPPPPLPLPSPPYKHKSTNTICYTKWRIQGRGPGAPGPSLIFRPNWGPKGREIFLGDRPPLLMSGSGLLGTSLIWRSGSATDTNFEKHLQNLVKPFKRMLHDTTQ